MPVCDFTFFGIATNASLAAFAFAAGFNRIACLSAAHTVPDGEYVEKRQRGAVACSKGAYTAAARESYKDGLARGLLEAVLASKAQKELEQQRRLEMARAKASTGEAWQNSDDDDDSNCDDNDNDARGDRCGGGGSDYEDDTKNRGIADRMVGAGVNTEEANGDRVNGAGVKKESAAADAVVKMEREAKAATALVAHTEHIEKDFLKESGVKLSHKKHKYTQSTWR